MEYINDEELLQNLLEREGVLSCFETRGLGFRLVSYKKHELLCSPDRPLRDLLFLVKGGVRVYSLKENGGIAPVSRGVGRSVLGTMEFARQGLPSFFTEALEDILAIVLPIEPNRALLEQDRVFLRFALGYLAQTVWTFTLMGHADQPVEERLLTFLRDIQPDHTLHGINTGLMQFHCSRRQLQRVVKKLCEQGALEKTGKGKYRLAGGQGHPEEG